LIPRGGGRVGMFGVAPPVEARPRLKCVIARLMHRLEGQ